MFVQGRSERYSFYAVGPTSLYRVMQTVSPLPALPKAPIVPLFFCLLVIKPSGVWQSEFYSWREMTSAWKCVYAKMRTAWKCVYCETEKSWKCVYATERVKPWNNFPHTTPQNKQMEGTSKQKMGSQSKHAYTVDI